MESCLANNGDGVAIFRADNFPLSTPALQKAGSTAYRHKKVSQYSTFFDIMI
jgi:hypothetical protein